MSTADRFSPLRRLPTFGPEPWPHPAPSGEWSYWDVWFAVACVVDCGGDWDDFDARLTRERSGGVVRGVCLEPLWSHLLDPRKRLAADGLGAAGPAGGAAYDPKVVARARAKVWKQALEDRADLDLVETLACAPHSEYVSARWDFRARAAAGGTGLLRPAAG